MRLLVREALETVIVALLLFLLLRSTVQNFKVEGASMEPSLLSGEYVFTSKLAYVELPVGQIAKAIPFWNPPEDEVVYPLGGPHQGEVVVFRAPDGQSRDFVKRVIAVEGDEVVIRKGVVLVDGRPLNESYTRPMPLGQSFGPWSVPKGYIFVLGDNRPASSDSRYWGPIPLSLVVGRVWLRYWPFSEADFFGAATPETGEPQTSVSGAGQP